MPKAAKKKKKFINKKEATTYQLIPGYEEDEEETTPLPKSEDAPKDPETRKEEQRQFGIFYDDEYNYLKHLRSVEEKATLVNVESFKIDDETLSQYTTRSTAPLPFREFFSTDETEEEKIDPEILAALDEAPVVKIEDDDTIEDGDDFLDDDFVAAAGGAIPIVKKEIDEHDEEDEGSDRDFDFDDEEDEDSDSDFDVSEDEFGSESEDRLKSVPQGRGTTQDDIVEAQTALILRNFEEGLGFQCAAQQSDDEEEMPTQEDYDNLKRILNQDKFSDKQQSLLEVLDDKSDRPKVDPKKYLYEDVDEFEWKDAPPSKPKFDCVSILSLNSNTRNLPTDLIPPKKEKSSRMPSVSETSEVNVRPGLTLSELESEMRESRRADKASTFRPKDETVEEKKARKKALKDERKERRQEKKANKTVFALEREKMKKETAALCKSVKGVAIS